MTHSFTRRSFLGKGTLLGCSLAASPLVTPVSFASAPWDHRLVVIILRGGLDGLDAVRPWGDGGLAGARPNIAAVRDNALDLDGFYGIHPALARLLPLWQKGELSFIHATSTPYRDKRSHFDGQDMLEAGTGGSTYVPARDGWLNRMLASVPGVTAHTAYALGREDMLLTTGGAPVANWTPEVDVALSAQGVRLLELIMSEDAQLRPIMAEALDLAARDGDAVTVTSEEEMMTAASDSVKATRGKAHLSIANFAAAQLRGDTRIASFSIGGWDTHHAQERVLQKPLGQLVDVLLALRDGVGADIWQRTTVLAMTEFGRTVGENGTKGTDHGTGGVAIAAGGALRGGRVYGDWPGLAEADLYARRDLMPTTDVRAWAAWTMRAGFGLSRSTLENQVFPGLDMGGDPRFLL